MKILIATGLYPPEIGGPATYARMVEEELPAHGYEVHVLPFGIVRHHQKIIRHLVYAWRLYQQSNDAAAIYALDPMSVGWPALVVARVRQLPLLVRLGGDYAWEQGRARFGLTATLDEYSSAPQQAPLMVRVLAWFQGVMTRAAKRVVVPSNYLKSIVEQWGVPSERIEVINSVLFPLEVAAEREALRRDLNYTFPTIVSAGRLVPWKGFPALIQAIAQLKKTYPTIQLIIAGEGSERTRLEELIKTLDLTETVRLVGSLSKDALGATIKAADVFVLNTAYEGLSHQLLEVMDLGVPIATTAVGGNPDLITHEETGLVFEYNNEQQITDSISRLMGDDALRHTLTQTAKDRVRHYTKDNSIQHLVSLLKETL